MHREVCKGGHEDLLLNSSPRDPEFLGLNRRCSNRHHRHAQRPRRRGLIGERFSGNPIANDCTTF
jgi:hypothetical protein